MAAIHHRSSNHPTVHPPSPNRGEDDEKRSAEAATSFSFDPGALCLTVQLELMQTNSPRLAAERIALANPEIAFRVSLLTKTEFDRQISPCIFTSGSLISETDIKKVLNIVYSTSLLNSRYLETTQRLETNIVSYLPLLETPRLASLIETARKARWEPPSNQPELLTQQIASTRQLCSQIDTILDLFTYADGDFKERVQHIYTDTVDGNRPRFRNCTKYGPRFFALLSKSQEEQTKLRQYRTHLIQKQDLLEKTIRPLVRSNHPTLSETRKQFIYYHAQSLWEIGTEILSESLAKLFSEKQKGNAEVPKELEKAIQEASQRSEFQSYGFAECLSRRAVTFPSEFVHAVWSGFVQDQHPIQDAADLMNKVIDRLPEEVFEKVRQDHNNCKAILKKYIAEQFNDTPTITSLKDWLA